MQNKAVFSWKISPCLWCRLHDECDVRKLHPLEQYVDVFTRKLTRNISGVLRFCLWCGGLFSAVCPGNRNRKWTNLSTQRKSCREQACAQQHPEHPLRTLLVQRRKRVLEGRRQNFHCKELKSRNKIEVAVARIVFGDRKICRLSRGPFK